VNDSLTQDQFDALFQISRARPHDRETACVARNIKTLAGLKYIRYGKDGRVALTEKGQQTLFLKRCIDGLRAVANNPLAPLDADIATFLSRKGHVAPRAPEPGFDLTQRGRESLADIDAASR
jgi:hypothetical protein